jgi:predicted HTH domain antitoxin
MALPIFGNECSFKTMSITIALPDSIEKAVPNAEWAALVGIAVEGFRNERLTIGQVGKLLGVSHWEAEQILGKNGCRWEMTAEEIETDVRALSALLDRKS